MALSDIIERIKSDGAAEAQRVVDAGNERAKAIREQAEADAAEERAGKLSAAEKDAAREASRILVAARLVARDEGLVKRRELVDAALSATADSLAALPDDRYAAFLAEKIAQAATGGEELRFGAGDVARAKAIVAVLGKLAPDVSFAVSAQAAPFDRGVLVTGDRVQADLSLPTIVEEQRDDLELVISNALFGEGQ